jgi:hypothetical protein
MKKFLIFIPLALLGVTGAYWITSHHDSANPEFLSKISMPNTTQALFTFSEHNYHEMIRHGDEQSLNTIAQALDALSLKLKKQQKEGQNVTQAEEMLALYKRDSTLACTQFTPKLKELHTYSLFEETKEKAYNDKIEQIGLYEIKVASNDLNQIRQEYIKDPSSETKIRYLLLNNHLKELIQELYLDSSTEKPLLSYLDNHKHYFESVSIAYEGIGLDRIHRLRTNGYAIKAALQLLPLS